MNLPKFFLLSIFSFGALSLLILNFRKLMAQKNRFVLLPTIGLLLSMLITLLTSGAPVAQQLFGADGRNTGFFTYLALVSLFLATALNSTMQLAKPLMFAIIGAFIVNVVYGFIQAIKLDPLATKWQNPYSPVVGTFGNPNFMGAFLGIGFAFAAAYLVSKRSNLKVRLLALSYLLIGGFDILKSDAQQGLIVAAASIGLVVYFLIKHYVPNKSVHITYLAISFLLGLTALFGTLQKGPLSSLLYKESVTYRGDYWHAGIQMFKTHPFFGVGLDSYGDWYRASRSLEATLRRGPSIVSNAAHNVFIDIAATAGIFALVCYLAIVFMGFRAARNIFKRASEFNPFHIGVFVAWVGYLIQSVISINNIALAIWGWILPGVLIAVDRFQSSEDNILNPKMLNTGSKSEFSGMVLTSGLIAGLIFGLIPIKSDAGFKNALDSQLSNLIYEKSQTWPTNPNRLMYAARIFDENKFYTQSEKLARAAVKLNPRDFNSWKYLYDLATVSTDEKNKILLTLKTLDPHNPDLAKLG